MKSSTEDTIRLYQKSRQQDFLGEKMKIAYLGAGTWGFCLARLLAKKGHEVICWSILPELVGRLNRGEDHPHLKGRTIVPHLHFTSDIEEALVDADAIVESVTSQGVRSVFQTLTELDIPENIPICLTSKGIEQNTGLTMSDVVIELMGEGYRNQLACLSGPSFAEEVSQELPTAVVVASYTQAIASAVAELFTTPYFRVYSNDDIRGVAFGGALKNIIAIACGISDGLKLGSGARAALMTRGLHEIVRLAKACDCKQETLYGLSGMGDLFLTCSSSHSRNWNFGNMLSIGQSAEGAKKSIDMVVEGAYTCVSALQLSQKLGIQMPIAQAVNDITNGKISPKEAVASLMSRSKKEETE